MSFRTKVLVLVDVIMRVPPLFIIDEILKISMGLPGSTFESHGGKTVFGVPDGDAGGTKSDDNSSNDDNMYSQIIAEALNSSSEAIRELANMNFTNDDTEEDLDFIKAASLTTLKFLICLIGEFALKTVLVNVS